MSVIIRIIRMKMLGSVTVYAFSGKRPPKHLFSHLYSDHFIPNQLEICSFFLLIFHPFLYPPYRLQGDGSYLGCSAFDIYLCVIGKNERYDYPNIIIITFRSNERNFILSVLDSVFESSFVAQFKVEEKKLISS